MTDNELDQRLQEIKREGEYRKDERAAIQSEDVGDDDQIKPVDIFRPTDTWNAQKLVSLYEDKIRYCHDLKTWLIWDETRWKEDEREEIKELAKETVREIYALAAQTGDQEERTKIGKHAQKSEGDYYLREMIRNAQSDPQITVSINDLNRDPLLFNCRNGTIDLKEGALLPHSKDDLITRISPVFYNPEAHRKPWTAYLNHVMAGNEGMIRYLKKISGYALTGEAVEECLFIFYGPGGSGKSTYLETMMEVMGDYAGGIPANLLLRKWNVSHGPAPELVAMKDKRFLVTVETGEDQRWDEPLVKLLTGGDTVTARRLFSNRLTSYRPGYKIFMATNHLPGTDSIGSAMKRRLKLIPFMVAVPEDDQDPRFKRNLRSPENLAGILNWMIEGCKEWQKHKLTDPEEIKIAYQQYQTDNDVLGEFIESRCIVHPDKRVMTKAFQKEYREWCDSEKIKPRGNRFISNRLQEKGFKPWRNEQGRGWAGIGLRNDVLE